MGNAAAAIPPEVIAAAQAASQLAEAPEIALGGKKWKIPVLSPRQNVVVVPIVLDLVPKIIAAREAAIEAGETGIAYLARFLNSENYEKLCMAVFTAITRGHPDTKPIDLMDMQIGTLELIDALFVVGRQCGFLRPEIVTPANV